MNDAEANRLLHWRRELGDTIRAGIVYVIANPDDSWAINIVVDQQHQWRIIDRHLPQHLQEGDLPASLRIPKRVEEG